MKVHQSARSQCPIMLTPKEGDRSINRAAWKYLWRASRTVWREHGRRIEGSLVDLMIYGRAEFYL